MVQQLGGMSLEEPAEPGPAAPTGAPAPSGAPLAPPTPAGDYPDVDIALKTALGSDTRAWGEWAHRSGHTRTVALPRAREVPAHRALVTCALITAAKGVGARRAVVQRIGWPRRGALLVLRPWRARCRPALA